MVMRAGRGMALTCSSQLAGSRLRRRLSAAATCCFSLRVQAVFAALSAVPGVPLQAGALLSSARDRNGEIHCS
jgi:hypothetical protein